MQRGLSLESWHNRFCMNSLIENLVLACDEVLDTSEDTSTDSIEKKQHMKLILYYIVLYILYYI